MIKKKRYTRDEHLARAQTFRRFALTINKPEVKQQYLKLAEYHEERARRLEGKDNETRPVQS